jgi:hypothetical protein
MAMGVRSGGQSVALTMVSIFALKSATAAEPMTRELLIGERLSGQQLTYGVDVGVAETDNVTLASTNKVSQTLAEADADFDFRKRSRLLDVDAKGNFTFFDYLQGAYGSQVVGRFDGAAHVALIPERLAWVLTDDYGQAALDPYTPVTPTNLENVNYVSTGPDLNMRLGPTGFFNASARFARSQYSTSPFNSNRGLGNLALGLQLSARSSVSLNVDAERVTFDNTALNSNFERTSGFVRYEVQGARTSLATDLGATTISRSGSSTTGGLARIELGRTLSAAAKLTLSAGRLLTDASTSFSNLQSGAIGVIGTAPAAQTSSTFIAHYASAKWEYKRSRTTLAVSGRWEKDTYSGQQESLDFTRRGAEFRVTRRLTRALTAELFGRYYKTDYPHSVVAPLSGSPNFDDEAIAGMLTWRHGRALEVRLRCEHDARLTAGAYGYRENRATLTVGYRPKPLDASSESY